MSGIEAPQHLPTAADVEAAATRLQGQAVEAPLLSSPAIDAAVGGRVLIKAECLQHTGSFKFRGAFNAIAQLSERERMNGVLAWSSGNHAQAVAAAAQQFGCPAVIVMPNDAPAIKVANTRALGAEVVLYDRTRDVREEIGTRLAAERGLTIVKPYDDARIVAGQGTAGLEAARQAAAAGVTLDQAVVPVSGGGLIAGVALGLHALFPRCVVRGAEPEGFDDLRRSLEAGERVSNTGIGGSLCDALLAPTPGAIPFAIHRRHVQGSVAVPDDDTLRAMRTAFDRLKIVLEPGGAIALAAVLTGRVAARGHTTLVVASGGNVDPSMFARALAVEPLA